MQNSKHHYTKYTMTMTRICIEQVSVASHSVTQQLKITMHWFLSIEYVKYHKAYHPICKIYISPIPLRAWSVQWVEESEKSIYKNTTIMPGSLSNAGAVWAAQKVQVSESPVLSFEQPSWANQHTLIHLTTSTACERHSFTNNHCSGIAHQATLQLQTQMAAWIR